MARDDGYQSLTRLLLLLASAYHNFFKNFFGYNWIFTQSIHGPWESASNGAKAANGKNCCYQNMRAHFTLPCSKSGIEKIWWKMPIFRPFFEQAGVHNMSACFKHISGIFGSTCMKIGGKYADNGFTFWFETVWRYLHDLRMNRFRSLLCSEFPNATLVIKSIEAFDNYYYISTGVLSTAYNPHDMVNS